jgi:spore coat protein U-like protein
MRIVLMVMLLCFSLSSQAACTLTTANFTFGAYSSANFAPLDATGSIVVGCYGIAGQTVNYTLAIETGRSGSFISRKMIYGPYALNYNLYLNAARTTVWGDGTVGTGIMTDSYALVAGTNVRNYIIYGRIPIRQRVPPGTYNDSLVVILTY